MNEWLRRLANLARSTSAAPPRRMTSVVETVRADLREDRYLAYVLLLSVVLFGFWIWYRVPNFATPDEYSRLIDPMKAAGHLVEDPSTAAFRSGVTEGRALGATFYLYGLTQVPVFLAVLVTGNLQEFANLGSLTSRWDLWYAAPVWFWTTSILLGRLVNVLLAVGCVYLTYRIGVETRDRATGRYGALLLSLSLGLISAAHELGEDVPMVFAFLLATYLALQYARAGHGRDLLLASAAGGLAIAFKLTGGVIVAIIAASHLLRARGAGRDSWDELWRPGLVTAAALVGAIVVFVGIPSFLLAGPESLLLRVSTSLSRKTGDAVTGGPSIGYQLIYRYLQSLGLPLFVAVLVGVGAQLFGIARGRRPSNGELLALVGLGGFTLAFSSWSFIHMHHLLPTLPLAVVLLGAGVSRAEERPTTYLRPLIALLLVTTAAYAVAGDLQYATDPRDRATTWIDSSVPGGETMVVYENSVADVATAHDKPVAHYPFEEENVTYSESLIVNETAFTVWMVETPERDVAYIQLRAGTLNYLDEESQVARQYPQRAEFVRRLVAGENGYMEAASFGVPSPQQQGLERLVRAGLQPEVEQRAEYVVVFERTDG